VLAPQRVTAVRRGDGGAFEVVTERAVHRARRVVLAIGRRGTPRKLGVPGEDSPKVAYRLLEPERWAGQRVLVVGGGNSAIEAAVSLAAAGATTTLSYRGSSFNRVAQANLDRLEAAARNAGLEVLLGSQLRCIEPEQVHLETAGGVRRIDNDQVFVFAGGELPTAFLDRIGVAMRWHHGERRTGAPRETACSVQARTAPPAAGGAGQGGAA
jgi:thioredoxin reductase